MSRISIVTPTLRRPGEVDELISNLASLDRKPDEWVIVDAGPPDDTRTRDVIERRRHELPFPIVYVTHPKGTAIQRNAGIELATGEFVAFIDDDIRLDADFFERLLLEFSKDQNRRVGAIVGYRTNERFSISNRPRWQMYRAMGLLKTFEPSRYDYETGYPINASLQPPFTGTREVDIMNSSNAMWRRDVFDQGLRFDPFFRDYGILEDAHLALSAKQRGWTLLQSGDAHCKHLHSPTARTKKRAIGVKSVVNYYYVFEQIAGPLSPAQQLRFWRFQLFEVMRLAASGVRRRRAADFSYILGKFEGVMQVVRDRR
jgi:glycosyltransferase involved in cell wall biosynthesis